MGYLMQFRAGVIVEVCCEGSEGKVYGGTRQKTAGWARVGVWKREALQIIQHNWNAECSERCVAVIGEKCSAIGPVSMILKHLEHAKAGDPGFKVQICFAQGVPF